MTLRDLASALPLRPQVRSYAWGSRTAIAELLGQATPAAEPQAELWMGTHPGAPSEVRVGDRWRPLSEVAGELPFLFKMLAAERPLSIQTHPDARQARAGFEREEAAGIGRDASIRNYRDANPKPEILFALTPFHVLRGFRPPVEVADFLQALDLTDLPGASQLLGAATAEATLEAFLRAWLETPTATASPWLDRLVGAARRPPSETSPELALACHWVLRLAEHYPGDRGLLAPLFLEVATLEPGEALFTGPRVFHAYLEGCGLELMVSSDNVLRGGLTQKHVDVPELLSVLQFTPEAPGRSRPTHGAFGEQVFESPGGELTLTRWAPSPQIDATIDPGPAGSILLTLSGEAALEDPVTGQTLELAQGACVFLPADGRSGLTLRSALPGTVVFQASGRSTAG